MFLSCMCTICMKMTFTGGIQAYVACAPCTYICRDVVYMLWLFANSRFGNTVHDIPKLNRKQLVHLFLNL